MTTHEPSVEFGSGPTLRILVHGAPYSGKTTTARTLGERLGQVVETPEEDGDGRTLMFDWMEYVGGRFEGEPIHTQLVTVPGHDPERRSHLLRDADVVLFVVDTREAALSASIAMLDEVRADLAERPETVGLVIQANKRDHPTAVPIAEVTSSLGLDADDVIIETVASDGTGVRQAFVYAVRLGLRHLAAQSGEPQRRAASAGELLTELRSTDGLDETDGVDETDGSDLDATSFEAEFGRWTDDSSDPAPPSDGTDPVVEPPTLVAVTVDDPAPVESAVPERASPEPASRLLDTLLAVPVRDEDDLADRLARNRVDRSTTDDADDDRPRRLLDPLRRWLRS